MVHWWRVARYPRRRKLLIWGFGAGLVLVMMGVSLYVLYPLRPVGGSSPIEVEIHSGMPAMDIAHQLGEVGLIRDTQAFYRWIRLTRNTRHLKAGKYRLSPELNGHEILKAIVRGDTLLQKFVIPEGYTVRDMAARWESEGFGTQQAFLDTCQQAADALGYSVEGYLFPDTYVLPPSASAQECIQMMLAQFENQWSKLQGRAANGLTKHEVVTLASIVEREAHVPEERALIAGVFHNRLKRGWKLQADPTVAYLLGYPNRPLVYKDLEIDSLYNTYRHEGLPPGPICSPGFASLQAAYTPAQTGNMYFVAQGDGTHRFSRTLVEHNRIRKEIKASTLQQ